MLSNLLQLFLLATNGIFYIAAVGFPLFLRQYGNRAQITVNLFANENKTKNVL